MVLVQKMAIFPTFLFLGNIGRENVFYDILKPKKRLSSLQKQDVQKVEKLTFLQRDPWFWSKNGHFSNIFFFRQYRSAKCLLRYSTTKNRLSRL